MKIESWDIVNTEIKELENRVCVVSYPNSGRTWLRALLSYYKQQLLDIDEFHIKIHAIYSAKPYSPQYLFHHALSDIYPRQHWWSWMLPNRKMAYPFTLSYCHDSRILFLLRSPKDTMVSVYHEMNERRHLFRGSISKYIRDPEFGIQRIVDFFKLIYTQAPPDDPNYLYVLYRELHEQPEATLSEILRFSGSPVKPEYLKEAINFAKMGNMRKMELDNRLIRPAEGAQDETNKLKVRKGKVGGYKDELSSEDIAFIDDKLRAGLPDYFLTGRYAFWLE